MFLPLYSTCISSCIAGYSIAVLILYTEDSGTYQGYLIIHVYGMVTAPCMHIIHS